MDPGSEPVDVAVRYIPSVLGPWESVERVQVEQPILPAVVECVKLDHVRLVRRILPPQSLLDG